MLVFTVVTGFNKTLVTYGGLPTQPVGLQLIDCGWVRLLAWQYASIAAPYWRLYWNGNSGASLLFDGRCTHLVPSRGVLIPPQTACATRLRQPVWHFCMHFVTVPSGLWMSPGVYPFAVGHRLRPLLDDLAQRLRDETPRIGLRTTLLCHSLVYDALSQVADGGLAPRWKDERIERVVRLMAGNLSTPLSVSELAHRTGMHLNTFIRFFKRVTGHTPHDYYKHLRMERAVFLLLSTRGSIEEVAAQTGYCDRFDFSRAFARRHGIGPAAFRRRHSSPIPPPPPS
ncbi:MAG: AraC family transcriptional regulator [Kiritimatiellae bacterium]|nr:AraC family transcriptional regulator [Kiritimatiellia bacterium]